MSVLGVPLRKSLRVGPTASSPHSFLAMGFPLMSLTRDCVKSIRPLGLSEWYTRFQFTIVHNSEVLVLRTPCSD